MFSNFIIIYVLPCNIEQITQCMTYKIYIGRKCIKFQKSKELHVLIVSSKSSTFWIGSSSVESIALACYYLYQSQFQAHLSSSDSQFQFKFQAHDSYTGTCSFFPISSGTRTKDNMTTLLLTRIPGNKTQVINIKAVIFWNNIIVSLKINKALPQPVYQLAIEQAWHFSLFCTYQLSI